MSGLAWACTPLALNAHSDPQLVLLRAHAQGLYCCGDSTFPGIGLPAVAASGAICANTLVPVWDHVRLLDELAL